MAPQLHGAGSQLELEAALFFKVDPSQLNLCPQDPPGARRRDSAGSSSKPTSGSAQSRDQRSQQDEDKRESGKMRAAAGERRREHAADSSNVRPAHKPGAHQRRPSVGGAKLTAHSQGRDGSRREAAIDLRGEDGQPIVRKSTAQRGGGGGDKRDNSPHRLNVSANANANGSSLNCPSNGSSNSLPSISSSPSVSPSIVCPHLSLDDLLECRESARAVSPHTIGLCARCRLDPPPNVHSPLSPMFKPFAHGQRPGRAAARLNQSTGDLRPASQVGQQAARGALEAAARPANCYTQAGRSLSNVTGGDSGRGRQRATAPRDDSLDYCLEPGELRRLQMSPALRNSVEFIRNNAIESGRVVKVYKNGEPYEKPLRVCVLRGEFANLQHFLDHLNTRLLVPLGARYLFHLDGQLVYSVQELKHGSTYVVSGARAFDYRASNLLREQQARERRLQGDKTNRGQNEHLIACQPALKQRPRAAAMPPPPQIAASSRPAAAPASNKLRASSSSFQRPAGKLGGARADLAPAGQSCESLDGRTPLGRATPIRPTRAKSELSALPKKRKKNVTFMDTGRGSSPAVSINAARPRSGVALDERRPAAVATSGEREHKHVQAVGGLSGPLAGAPSASASGAPTSQLKEFNTSDVGIQVSDSIDGFLIDLPVALPARGDDANLRGRRPGASGAAGARVARQQAAAGGKRRQIVTISERQLSLEEMNELRDLSQGDHHHEPIVELENEEAEGDGSAAAAASGEAGRAQLADELELVPDRTNTIAIGSDPQVDMGTQTSLTGGETAGERSTRVGAPRRLITAADQGGSGSGAAEERWQYPGGRAASGTPTERPVSQSGPSETVRARVTTPTPSLSTANGEDSNSLSMSYEPAKLAGGDGGVVSESEAPQPAARPLRPMPARAPPKKRAEVTGSLCPGLHAPEHNFRLLWVNGFAINDLYPENSASEQRLLELEQQAAAAAASSERARSSSPSGRRKRHLSPEQLARAPPQAAANAAAAPFKPSERYHNWICHSRRHNELVYPAGSLVVLWCQWTNEQRFYAKHSANVSAVSLATLDLDLAASAQVCELHEQPQIHASVHLWSLADLSTLMVVEHEQLRARLIFSLRVKNTKSGGCELSVGARDEKQLFLFTFHRRLTAKEDNDDYDDEAAAAPRRLSSEAPRSPARRASREQPVGVNLSASKALQSNQVPLFIMKVPGGAGDFRAASNAPVGRQQPAEPLRCEPVICFGRRCFQVWSADVRQQKLRPMQQEGKTGQFASLLGRANCLCRLSPGELLVGDADGNIALLATSSFSTSAGASMSPAAAEAQRRARAKPSGNLSAAAAATSDLRYAVETRLLLGPLAEQQGAAAPKLTAGGGGQASKPAAAITSLTRVTGSLFISADTTCAVRFWKIQQEACKPADGALDSARPPTVKLSSDLSSSGSGHIWCEQLASISLPPDLGFVCAVLLANYQRADSLVEFYIISTCNTILFGSVKLGQQQQQQQRARNGETEEGARELLLANSSLSVVYEGHETAVASLVADFPPEPTRAQLLLNKQVATQLYFTSSLDRRICKWDGQRLVWKSMLPSACVSLAVHPVGFVLAAGSADGTVYILDKVSGLLVAYFPLTPVRINCLAYSRDGALLAAGCANGSIFILPVYERGLKYKKVSIFQSPSAVVSLQFSLDNRFMLTSVTRAQSQELILWDLPNFRYMRDNVKLVADKIAWFDSICSGSEDVRAIWENANLAAAPATTAGGARARPAPKRDGFVINLSCHRLIRARQQPGDIEPQEGNYVIASDTRGFLRLFRYPSYDIRQGFRAVRISSSAVNCCRFLGGRAATGHFVSASTDGAICLWALE